jgi:hypothetical protein
MADTIGGKDGSEATFGGRLPWQDRYDRRILGPRRSNGESGKGQSVLSPPLFAASALGCIADERGDSTAAVYKYTP